MCETYAVYFGNQVVGNVQALRQGLYYRFICRCRLTGGVMCRLVVCCGDQQENLGILVPVEDGFGLDTRLPIKRLGTGKLEFCVTAKHDVQKGRLVPIYPEEPFAYIARLKYAYLMKKDGQVCAVIKE